MVIYQIKDLSEKSIILNNYDMAFFSSGYEERSFNFCNLINIDKVAKYKIFGFNDHQSNELRLINDLKFKEKTGNDIIIIDGCHDDSIFNALSEIDFKSKNNIKILIDYSTMTRTWYASILNYFKFLNFDGDVLLDFVYSIGEHTDNVLPLETQNILSLPGCEGRGFSTTKCIAYFGLGFDGICPLSVIDQLEPDICYGYIADPGAFKDYSQKALDENSFLIENFIGKDNIIRLPLASVEMSYQQLSESISPYLFNNRITFVPLGPKPHVLTAILLSMRFPEITCLHVSGKKVAPESVKATGRSVVTRVFWKNNLDYDLTGR